jgi:hypothetical protein
MIINKTPVAEILLSTNDIFTLDKNATQKLLFFIPTLLPPSRARLWPFMGSPQMEPPLLN